MPLSKSSPEVTKYIYEKFKDAAVDLGLRRVFYGEQNLIDQYPAIEIASGRKRRSPTTTHQFGIEFRTILTISLGQIGQVELSQEDVERLVEAAEDLLHADMSLGEHPDNLVISSWVEATDPGVRLIETRHIKAVRMTWFGLSREYF